MFQNETYEDHGLMMYKLFLPERELWMTVCPERGGIITEYHVDGQDVFYLNKESLYDRGQNIRGGNPVLFPMAGQLTNGSYEWEGNVYNLPNHGLVRQAPWDVITVVCDDDYASITLQCMSNAGTLESFPFPYKIVITYTLTKEKLILDQKYYNLSNEVMPVYPGFHPYFHIQDHHISIQTNAKTLYDYNDNTIKEFNGTIDMNGKQEMVVLIDSTEPRMVTTFNESKNLVIEKDSAFSYTVVWVQEGKDFACIEPWTAKKDEYNRKEELIMIQPKDVLGLSVSYQLVSK